MEKDIVYRDLSSGPVEACRDLCDKLMAYQAEKAVVGKEIIASMCFENRLKPSFENAAVRFLLVAYDGEKPVGYMFATVDTVTEESMNIPLSWMKLLPPDSMGFYPPNFPTPTKVGCLNNLFLLPEYRGLGIGKELFERGLEWLRGAPDLEYWFLDMSNGNNMAPFYEKYGFRHSHAVFGGIIEAYSQPV